MSDIPTQNLACEQLSLANSLLASNMLAFLSIPMMPRLKVVGNPFPQNKSTAIIYVAPALAIARSVRTAVTRAFVLFVWT